MPARDNKPQGAPPSPKSGPHTAPHPLIVGIGASAGGLEAFKNFFKHMPADSEMAFVLVQHLAPDHQSMLAELVGRGTQMTVQEAEDGEKVQARHVYVIPPDATLTISDGALQVSKPAPPRQHRWPIDTFFTSLAQDQGDCAVCIVLSGSGSDGARGLRAVKEHGGLTLAQAGFDHVAMSGMPASAEATGLVDEVLAVEAMPARLLAHYKLLQSAQENKDADGLRSDMNAQLQNICAVLRAETGHDFSQYKEKTLIRRIQRRMQVTQTKNVADYLALLRRDNGECHLLFHELLIGVTEFFRDPAAFEALQTLAFPPLLAGKSGEDTLRVWVAGCATGEEAYSVAIALKEAMGDNRRVPKVMIFGTDIDDHAITSARSGRFRAPLHGISPERAQRWFIREGEDFVVSKAIREMCVFSPHSVNKDPPFSRLDLITCRNLLIYLNADLQQKLVRMFHYALRPGGFMMLGPSEGISRNARLFATLDKKHRLFARRNDVSAEVPGLPMRHEPPPRTASRHYSPAPLFAGAEQGLDRAARRVLEKYAPAYVVIDEHHDILRFGGDSGRYLGPSSGAASLNLFALLHRGLRGVTRNAVKRALADGASAHEDSVHERAQPLRIIAEPFADADSGTKLCVVAFMELQQAAPAQGGDGGGASARALEQELETTRTQLHAAQEQHETLNEEMKSANEEYQSVNEELQSSNEELETSKEEMQSINEELHTVNTELQTKNAALSALNSDLRNLLESTHVATLFLGDDLRIRNYTPTMTDLFHLRDGDRGRPITEISARINYPQLREDTAQVLRSLGMVERTLRGGAGDPIYLLRMRPYRTVENVIDGVVLTFFDISERERHQAERKQLAAIIDSSRDAVIGYDGSNVISSWNAAAERLFGYSGAQAIGQPLAVLLPPEAQAQAQALPDLRNRPLERMEVEMEWLRRDGSRVEVAVTGSSAVDARGHMTGGSLIARDNAERLRGARHTEMMMGELNHRVKNTLATVQAIAQQTLKQTGSVQDFSEVFMSRLLSLSATHNLLAREMWNGADLGEIVLTELQPFLDGDGVRVKIEGEPLRLNPKAALAMSMAVHELTTNAIKYGALLGTHGCVAVNWKIGERGDEPVLRVDWIESSGPTVREPRRRGFGHRLITEGLALELDGEVELRFVESGVVCRIEIPLRYAQADA